MQRFIILLLFFSNLIAFSQEKFSTLTLEEYLGYVKKYHPIVKQAQLITTTSEARLLKSRGAFDPKLEVDFNRKKFAEKEYYNKLNTTFKIPTWYGVEIKANYENNTGAFLNQELNVPNNGLYSTGVSVSLAKGLLINKRMATLKQAKLYIKQAQAKQKLLVNTILYEAIISYFNWLKNYQAKQVYTDYLKNATVRFQNVKKSYVAGDKPAVDTLEASINVKNRILDIEKAKIGYIKSTLELSNYLWLANNLPLELESNIIPNVNTIDKIDGILNSSILNINDTILENHPKILELKAKKDILLVDKRLKTNNLLPTIDLEYNFLTTNINALNTFHNSNYKSGLNINFPLFLRKERASLKLAKLKLKDIDFDILATKISLKNKIEALLQEIESYSKQHTILLELVKEYDQLMKSEERKFSLGEGSLFLVNYREVKLFENQFKKIDTEYQLFIKKSNLLNILNNLF